MPNRKIKRIKGIQEFHRIRGLSKPAHPLISLVDYSQVHHSAKEENTNWVQDYYTIGLKRNVKGKFRYGQQRYDFDEGLLSFIAPGQVFGIEAVDYGPGEGPTGWLLLVHPDFLWNTPLAKQIKQYGFFGYSVHESLFLSEREEATVLGILRHIEQEYNANIDGFSQGIILAQIELLLNYADRFYNRQFITRKISNHRTLERVEAILGEYFNAGDLMEKGLPSVQFLAQALNMSPNYLGSLLRSLTGESTQQHIHNKLIEKAKEKLSTTELSVGEIAYALGFEHPQSFSKLFKSKTKQSPMAFRASFN